MENKKIDKIISFQQFSISDNGGGSRILRRLTENNISELLFFSVITQKNYKKHILNNKEIIYGLFPIKRKWMRWFIRDINSFLKLSFFYFYNSWIINRIAFKKDFNILHIVDQGKYSNVLLKKAIKNKIQIWVSFHDHFLSNASYKLVSQDLWKNANKRMVISKQLGVEYCNLFGEKPFIIVTDGIKSNEIFKPKTAIISKDIQIYFAGLLHLDYYPLFETFCNTLDYIIKEKKCTIKLILRGTQKLDFLSKSLVEIEYKEFTLDSDVLIKEMNDSDILYLPMKYSNEYFYKYSFSTKMIGYLGASGNIFYHGPKDSAAAIFLQENGCAVVCDSLDPKEINDYFNEVVKDFRYSENAKEVSANKFSLREMQSRFWS